MEMVHKSAIIPGLSTFIDNSILAQYPPNSMKRILGAGAISLFLNQNTNVIDNLLANPMVKSLNIVNDHGMINLELLRDYLKTEINKVGFMRITLPLLGEIDFVADDVDMLYSDIVAASTNQIAQPPAGQQITQPAATTYSQRLAPPLDLTGGSK
jgi:hypothetical protein